VRRIASPSALNRRAAAANRSRARAASSGEDGALSPAACRPARPRVAPPRWRAWARAAG
jgi:hypothetical protein